MSETKKSIRNIVNRLFSTGFFHIFGSSTINKVIGFLSSIVLVRILTKPEYGTFTYAWNKYSIIILLSGLGVESGMLQLASEHSGDADYALKVTDYSTRFGLKVNVLLAFVLLGIGLFFPLKLPEGRYLICTLCLLPIVQLMSGMTSCYLRSQKRNQEFSKLAVINTALVFTVSAGCAFFLREMGLVIGHYTGALAVFIIGRYVYRVRLFDQRAGNLNEEKKDLLKISIISMVNNSLSQLMYLLDVFVLGIVDPQETILASYKVATIIPTALSFIPLSLITYLYPYYAEHRNDGQWCLKHYKKILLGLGAFNLAVSALMFLLAPFIIQVLFGKEYLDSVTVFRILSLNYFFSGTFRILSGNLLVTQRKLKFNLLVAIVSSTVNIVADYFLIQRWGSVGAAAATVSVVLISSIMSTTYLIYTFKKQSSSGESQNNGDSAYQAPGRTGIDH